MEKVSDEKTKPDGTDGYARTILPSLRILLKRTILSVVKMNDCSTRKTVSEWSERKRSVDVLDILEDYCREW